MTNTKIQSLSAIARAESEGITPDDGGPPMSDEVPMSVRLDFAALLTQSEHAELHRPDSVLGALPVLPLPLYAIWRIRTDLNQAFDIAQSSGYAALWLWAIRDGRRELDVLWDVVAQARNDLLQPVVRVGGGKLPVSLPWIAGLLWCARPDVQQVRPLASDQDAAQYLGWFLRQGVFEARCGDLIPDDHVAVLAATEASTVPPALVRYLEFLHATRTDLQETFSLQDFNSRRDFLKWFYDQGLKEYPTHPDIAGRQTQIVYEWGEAAKSAAEQQKA
ncbi:MAG: hypothetical protein HQ481_05845 [Alphaproteobacteria bacterium]|nr:hypothetical protein [Alphaproteobacteria bacterium]